MSRIVIVGASLAGANAARSVRRAGFDGELVLVGEEDHRPYDRPPLSKEFLVDGVDEERLRLRATAEPEELSLTWRPGRRAERLDADGTTVHLDDGDELAYDGLIVATGARPRRLPSTGSGEREPSGLFVLRTLDDARALRRAFDAGPGRVVVCGAGFIGAEVASSARRRGLAVTMLDAAAAPLERVLDRDVGLAIARFHADHDVDVRLEVAVESILTDTDTDTDTDTGTGDTDTGDGDAGTVRGVALTDGSVVDADVVVVGIGVVPNTEWVGDELPTDDGILADATCVAAPGIVTAGDVCRWPNQRFGGRLMRIEQWDNAVEMGGYAGGRIVTMLDGDDPDEPFAPVPWFWSDQYDRKLQLAGLAEGSPEIVQGSLDGDQLVRLYIDEEDRLRGALCWNRPRQAIMARQLIGADATADEARDRLGD